MLSSENGPIKTNQKIRNVCGIKRELVPYVDTIYHEEDIIFHSNPSKSSETFHPKRHSHAVIKCSADNLQTSQPFTQELLKYWWDQTIPQHCHPWRAAENTQSNAEVLCTYYHGTATQRTAFHRVFRLLKPVTWLKLASNDSECVQYFTDYIIFCHHHKKALKIRRLSKGDMQMTAKPLSQCS